MSSAARCGCDEAQQLRAAQAALGLACEHEDWPGWKLIPPDGVEHCRKHCLLRCEECGFGLESGRRP